MKKQNANLLKVVHALSAGGFHDGTTIGQKLNITRSAVCKTIARLKQYGVPVVAVKGKGYALENPLILLNPQKINTLLAAYLPKLDISLQVFESIASTNDYLRLSANKKPLMTCLAEQQTHGKGRMGREWYSPFGLNVYSSCLFRFDKDVSELAGLSLVTGLVVAKTLNAFLNNDQQAAVKWPNDVLVAGKKIAGILIEVQAETHGACYAVIGVGMNVNMDSASQPIGQPYTSLSQLTGRMVDRNELCAKYLANLWQALQLFNREGLAPFMQEWETLDCLRQQVVTLQRANEKMSGVVQGVNEQGHLLLCLAEGVRAFSSGDVTIAKS